MGSRKFKVLAAVLLAGMLACGIMLAGCGGSSSSSAAKSTSSASKSTSTATKSSSSTAQSTTAQQAATSTDYVKSADASDPYASGKHHATVTVEGYEPFTIELDADAAPVSVSNFCKLANAGYYNGLTFYRFSEDFCMQGGTKGNSAAGQDDSIENIVGEFSGNGVKNALADDFKKGTVAMARSQDPNSASSTFFVTLDTSDAVSQSLDGQYAAFGMIDEAGMAIVDQIVADYLPKVTDPTMGAIAKEADQAKIQSITITD